MVIYLKRITIEAKLQIVHLLVNKGLLNYEARTSLAMLFEYI